MCNNVVEFFLYPYNINTTIELFPTANCANDPYKNKFNWQTFWKGLGLVFAAVTAVVIAATTFGAGIPVSMQILAGVTIGAASLVGINGVATMAEAGTNYNFMRDGLFGDVFGLDEEIYYGYETVTETVMSIGAISLGIYHMTGQYKAAKYGQKFLGKGYSKVKGKKRWISQDGLRQMIFDDSHHFIDGVVSRNHFNLNIHASDMRFGKSKILQKIHLEYSSFRMWLR